MLMATVVGECRSARSGIANQDRFDFKIFVEDGAVGVLTHLNNCILLSRNFP